VNLTARLTASLTTKNDEESQGQTDSRQPVGTSLSEVENDAPGPRRSTRRPTPKVTWSEKDIKAYLDRGAKSPAKDVCALTKLPAREKEARPRPDWPLCQ